MDVALKEFIASQSAETRRHVDAVADSLGHEIRLVAEGVLGNTAGIERLEMNVRRLDSNDGLLQAALGGLHRKADAIESRLDQLESDMKAEFVEIHTRIDRLEPPSTH